MVRVGFPRAGAGGGNLVFISQATPPELHTLSITFKLYRVGKFEQTSRMHGIPKNN